MLYIVNKTGLQPISRPLEQVQYFGVWVEARGCKVPLCLDLADRQEWWCQMHNNRAQKLANQTDRRTDKTGGALRRHTPV